MDNPLVSIIIPVYNAEKYIKDTLESALNQSWKNKEIIIIDDGSTDGSADIVSLYRNGEIKFIPQKNQGSGAARNNGIRNANGEFIQFLDAGDLLSADKIENQVKALLKPGNRNKVAVCSTIHFPANEEPEKFLPTDYEEQYLTDNDSGYEFLINLLGGNANTGSMVQTNAWLTPSGIIRKAGFFEEFYSPDDDGEYFTRVLLACDGVVKSTGFNYYRKSLSGSLADTSSELALEGCYRSLLLKAKSLAKYKSDARVNKVLALSLKDIILTSYPAYKELYQEALSTYRQLSKEKLRFKFGGLSGKVISALFGWKTARYIQHLRSKG